MRENLVLPWKFFKENDVIDVVAPGYAVKPEDVEGAREFLLKWNLKPRIPKGMIKSHFLHSHDDEARWNYLKNAFDAGDSRVIWCLRGGYGSNRLLPYLAKMKKPKEPKLLIGISDITSLHTFLIQEWGWAVLHAPLLDRLGRNLISKKHQKEIYDVLFGNLNAVEFKNLKPLNEAAKSVSTVKSRIVGGNLTVLQSTLGTPWQIDANRKFLFVEDIGERGYRVDRIFEQFRQAGIFKKCQGLILGDFIGGQEPDGSADKTNLVFKRWAADLEIPLFKGLQAGHSLIQRPVPFNTSCELKMVNGRGQLLIQTGGKA